MHFITYSPPTMSANAKEDDDNAFFSAASDTGARPRTSRPAVNATKEYDPDDGVCRNIQWGTSNHVFYEAKYGKKVCISNTTNHLIATYIMCILFFIVINLPISFFR